jgi:hypothetical protein
MIAPIQIRRLAGAGLSLLLAGSSPALAETTADDSPNEAATPAAPANQPLLQELATLERLLDAHARNPATPMDEPTRRQIEWRLAQLRHMAESAAGSPLAASQAASGASDLTARIESLGSRLQSGPKRRSVGPGVARTAGPIPAAPPANDTCATATPIGNGTFPGDTSEAGSDGAASCDDTDSSPDAWFEYTAPATGSAYFNTFGSSYDTVLSVHSACPGTVVNEIDCNDDAGSKQSEILMDVTASETLYLRVSGYDGDVGAFVLTTGITGSISGTVTEAGSGDPVTGQGSGVIVYRSVDGDSILTEIVSTDAGGNYAVEGLPPGSYRVIARGLTQVNELYDDFPCPGGINSCFPERGTEVVVTGGVDTSGIDFVLAPGGSISGTMTRLSDGTPIFGPSVDVFDASGNPLLNDITAGDGSYSVTGLPTGEYFVATSVAFPQADLLYPDLPCPGGGDSGACDVRTGTAVSVTVPSDTPGIDFALPEGGSISGTVTEEGSGDPLGGIGMRLYSAAGDALAFRFTTAGGSYSFTGLHDGSYRLVTTFAWPRVGELWDDITCHNGPPDGCSPPDGDPVAVTAPAETAEVDFALALGGSLSGSVTEDPSGTPLSEVRVEAYNADAAVFVGTTSTGGAGSWIIEGLPTGSYRVQTFGAAPHADELYDDMACPNGWCDVTPGTPVALTAPADTGSIDFALAAAGAISGTVTEAGSGTPLSGIEVEVFDAAGEFAGWDATASDGAYTIDGLPTGTYHVATVDAPAHVDELYDNITCPGGGGFGCDPTTGAAVAVTAPSTTVGIDLALATGGVIAGTVTDAVTGLPVDSEVTIFNAAGSPLGFDITDGAGHFVSLGLPTGTYYARTDSLGGFLEHRFGGLSCVGSCDAQLSSPIVVTSPSATMGVDFALYKPGADDALVLSHEDVDGAASFCSEGTITLGPDLGLVGAADLELLAAGTVVFESGFSAAAGTTLEVGLDPAAKCP